MGFNSAFKVLKSLSTATQRERLFNILFRYITIFVLIVRAVSCIMLNV
jgi:hypothetical protein